MECIPAARPCNNEGCGRLWQLGLSKLWTTVGDPSFPSSREVRIRVPFFSVVYFSRESSPKKGRRQQITPSDCQGGPCKTRARAALWGTASWTRKCYGRPTKFQGASDPPTHQLSGNQLSGNFKPTPNKSQDTTINDFCHKKPTTPPSVEQKL